MKLSLVIPFYNEEKNVVNVLRDTAQILEKNKIDYEIIAVQNGSKDKTSELIDRERKKNTKIRKLDIKVNQGLGWGVLSGMRRAKGDITGWICGDCQIDNECIIKVYNLAKKYGPKGIYKMRRIKRDDGFKRKIISIVYNCMVKALFNIDTMDPNATPKLFYVSTFRKMKLTSKDWFIDTEIMIKAKRLKLQTYEVPGLFKKRESGKSNIHLITSFEFLKNLLIYRLGFK